ncbi:MAG: AMP-binding protein [Microthrixaceae bacterium]
MSDRVPEREAVVCGDQRRTYGHLEDQANHLANHFLDQGVGPGDFVGCYLPNSISTSRRCWPVSRSGRCR